jgi:hypothetical protein
MSPYWKAMAGSFTATIIKFLFAVVFAVMGWDMLGLTTWLVSDLADKITPAQARWFFSGLALAVLFFGIVAPAIIRTRRFKAAEGLRITARQVVPYLVNESRWGWRTWLELRGDEEGLANLCAIVRIDRAAQQNVVHFRGRRWDSQAHEDIDPDQWRRIGIASDSVLGPSNNSGETESKTSHYPQPPKFEQLTVPDMEILAAWPRAGLLYRLAMVAALLIIRRWWCLLWPFEVAYARWKRWRAENI